MVGQGSNSSLARGIRLFGRGFGFQLGSHNATLSKKLNVRITRSHFEDALREKETQTLLDDLDVPFSFFFEVRGDECFS